MTIHELKTWPEYFEAVAKGFKTFEVRKDDRGFKAGDVLCLYEWNAPHGYTGRVKYFGVPYILRGGEWGVDEETVVMSLGPVPWDDLDAVLTHQRTLPVPEPRG